jgi:hypothetical protein
VTSETGSVVSSRFPDHSFLSAFLSTIPKLYAIFSIVYNSELSISAPQLTSCSKTFDKKVCNKYLTNFRSYWRFQFVQTNQLSVQVAVVSNAFQV